ncbi:MAG: serine hydrolase [Crocinitomicaceae bacterium]|nr:serine hydrolase [Crocinitomicaceae bacterium]
MNFKLLILLFALLVGSISHGQNKRYTKILDEFIEQGMTDWNIPGLSAVVVQNNDVVYHRSFGVLEKDKDQKVNEETLFTMASTTKAITAICLGMLVDEGKIAWNDNVIEHYPNFNVSDPYVRSTATIKDVLTHVIGFDGVATWYGSLSDTTQSAVYENYKKMEQIFPFRSSWEYSNDMYAVAGAIIEHVSGDSYSTFIKKRIFEPLEMNHSILGYDNVLGSSNAATPHDYDSESNVYTVSHSNVDHYRAAGGIWSCTKDVVNYLKFINNQGVFNGEILLKKATFDYLFTPHVTLTPEQFHYPICDVDPPNWLTYGLGWFQHDYNGTKIDFHTGSLHGLVSIIGVIREKNTAVYLFANQDHAEFRHAFLYKALDLYAFDSNDTEWDQKIIAVTQAKSLKFKRYRERVLETRVEGTSPAHDLNEYAGMYYNNELGRVQILVDGDQLKLKLNQFDASELQHWNYETFKGVQLETLSSAIPFVTFINSNIGTIESLRIFGQYWNKR